MKINWLLVQILVAIILAYSIVLAFFSGNTKFEELALGTETVTYQAVDENNKLIHIQHLDSLEEPTLRNGWEDKGKKDVILFLGNSQTHSINQRKNGEVNYVELLYNRNKANQTEILCVSQPNAGLQQFYLTYSYYKKIMPLKIIVIPLFMDDMREDGIRADVFFPKLISDKFQVQDTADFFVEKINADLRSHWLTNSTVAAERVEAKAESNPTLQEETEGYLNSWLDEHSTIWSNRQNVRGDFFNWTYKLRNTALGIKANTIRKMIPQRYDLNLHALKLIVRDCMINQTKVILYIPPIRSDVPSPYDLDEYNAFKKQIEDIATQYKNNILYANFESIIPAEYWGYKDATNLIDDREIDYMHFQFQGHQILADSLQVRLDLLK